MDEQEHEYHRAIPVSNVILFGNTLEILSYIVNSRAEVKYYSLWE